jgi:type I restriction enzyme S subunit
MSNVRNNQDSKPAVRFKGFSDAWEQRKLSDGTNKIGDGLHGTPKYSEDGEVYFVNGNNLVNGQIVIMPETKRVTSNEQSKDDKALNENTILMSINGTIGNLAWYRGENLMLGKSAAYIEVSDFDKKFIYTYLQTRPVKDYYLNSLTGTTIKNLGLKAIRNTNICTPTIDEQVKIGVLFQNLDKTITLHQRKVENLQKLKKSLLQQMFVSGNDSVPKIRFAGFADAWEQRKVSELADRYDNLRVPITASERVAGETPYYGANGIQDYVEGFTHNGEFVLVAEDGANDLQNYPVQYVDGKVWVNNHAHVLQAKEERVDNKFLTNALKHTNIEPYLVGGGRAKLNADVMMKINFKVPTLPEQVQIGKLFDNLDHLITLHQRKVENLQKLKKSLLHLMFI